MRRNRVSNGVEIVLDLIASKRLNQHATSVGFQGISRVARCTSRIGQ